MTRSVPSTFADHRRSRCPGPQQLRRRRSCECTMPHPTAPPRPLQRLLARPACVQACAEVGQCSLRPRFSPLFLSCARILSYLHGERCTHHPASEHTLSNSFGSGGTTFRPLQHTPPLEALDTSPPISPGPEAGARGGSMGFQNSKGSRM